MQEVISRIEKILTQIIREKGLEGIALTCYDGNFWRDLGEDMTLIGKFRDLVNQNSDIVYRDLNLIERGFVPVVIKFAEDKLALLKKTDPTLKVYIDKDGSVFISREDDWSDARQVSGLDYIFG